MSPRFIIVPLLTALLSQSAVAIPVLVAVDLETHQLTARWVDLGFPAYELLGQTAIAEVDDRELPALRGRGFRPAVIDESPWSDLYFLCNIRPELQTNLPGSVIWSGHGVQIIELAAAQNSLPSNPTSSAAQQA